MKISINNLINFITMETNVKVFETNFDELGVVILDKNETMETDGGIHYEWINGALILVDN